MFRGHLPKSDAKIRGLNEARKPCPTVVPEATVARISWAK